MADRTVPIPADATRNLAVGDVIQVKGDSVPRALWGCWFRVESKTESDVKLSVPFVNQALTLPFQWHGSQRGSALALERRSRKHRAA